MKRGRKSFGKMFHSKKGGFDILSFFSGIASLVNNTVISPVSGWFTSLGISPVLGWIGIGVAAIGVTILGWNLLTGGNSCNQACIDMGFTQGGSCNVKILNAFSSNPCGEGKAHANASCALFTRCCCKGDTCTLPDGTKKECGPDGLGGSCGECSDGFVCNETTFKCVPESNEALCKQHCGNWTPGACGGDSCSNSEMLYTRKCDSEYLSLCNQTRCEKDDTCTSNETNPHQPPAQAECTDIGKTKCNGHDLYQCVAEGSSQNGASQGTWKLLETDSTACAPDDGDFSPSKCSAKGGVWLSSAPTQTDWDLNGYCCGDDGNADLGKRFGNALCVNDNGFKWIVGANGQRYVHNTLLFCDNHFYFCNDNQGYPVNAKSPCSRECKFFCNVQNNEWTADSEYNKLRKPIGNDTVDSLKKDMEGNSACCPKSWCYDGDVCVENQVDEACDDFVYSYNNMDYRCRAGNWYPAVLKTSWDDKNKGYCPDMMDCFVGCGDAGNNYKPDTYFSGNGPQCIASGQYILDNECAGGFWKTRTSLVATKLVQIASPLSADNYVMYCGKYPDVLNEYNYVVDGKSVYKYLDDCRINGTEVPCVNNICVLKTLSGNKQIFLGVTLNRHGFEKLLGAEPCNSVSADEWDYKECSDNLLYNSKINALIFSDKQILNPNSASGWEIFSNVIMHPIVAMKNLIKEGSVYYVYTPGEARLQVPLLSQAPKFDRFFIMKKGDKSEDGVFETGRWDNQLNKSVNEMLILFRNYPKTVCDKVNDFAESNNVSHTTCFYDSGNAYITESSVTNSYLLNYWLDLTTKLKP